MDDEWPDDTSLYDEDEYFGNDETNDEENIAEIADDESGDVGETEPAAPRARVCAPEDRLTPRLMTRYEYAAVVGVRATHLGNGAQPLVGSAGSPIETAKLELQLGILPYTVRRMRPDGMIEVFRVSELDYIGV